MGYAISTSEYTISVAWANPFKSYFAQVWRGDLESTRRLQEEKDHSAMVLEVGLSRGEVPTVEALAELIKPYGEIPPQVKSMLEEDRRQSLDKGTRSRMMVSVEKAKRFMNRKEYAEADTLLLAELPSDSGQFVKEHPGLKEPVTEINELLAVSACQQGNLEAAERYALATCALREKTTASYARSASLLGEVYWQSGKEQLAQRLAQIALAEEGAEGITLTLAWRILSRSDALDFPEKLVCLAKAIIAYPVKNEEDEKEIASTFKECMETLVELGESQEAKRLKAEFARRPGRLKENPPTPQGT